MNPTMLRISSPVNIFPSDFFEPIHTFEIEPVAQRPQGAEQNEKYDCVHRFVFFELDIIFT